MANAPYFEATSKDTWDPYLERFREEELAATQASRRKDSNDSQSATPEAPAILGQSATRWLEQVNRRALYSCSPNLVNFDTYERLTGTALIKSNGSCGTKRRLVNALHRSLYKPPNSSDFGEPELVIGANEIVNISAVHKGYRPNSDGVKRVKFAPTPEEEYYSGQTRWGPQAIVTGTQTKLSAEALAKQWSISLKTAANTIKVTTQRGVRNLSKPLVRRMPTQRWRNKRVLSGRWYSDTMKFKDKSILRQQKMAQVFTNSKGFDSFYPIDREKQCSDALVQFVNEIGIPERLVVNGAKA